MAGPGGRGCAGLLFRSTDPARYDRLACSRRRQLWEQRVSMIVKAL